ncbi:MAG: hypothetical protein IKZ59_04155 [Clostridia bacterium]|nr:hypothetical protein [Clostridia bacterium]
MSTRGIIRKIAKQNGVTPKEVREDMKAAIRASMTSNSPGARAFWSRLSPDGKEPSIGEFIRACAEQIEI